MFLTIFQTFLTGNGNLLAKSAFWTYSALLFCKNHGYGYSCLEKLSTEKCKHKANQPEKKILKIKDFMKDL